MQLSTERLYLREFVASDWQAVLAYQSDARYLRYYEWEDRTPDEVRAFVAMFLGFQREEPRTKFQLAINHRETNRLIGNCGIRKATSQALEADLGYELAPEMWGRVCWRNWACNRRGAYATRNSIRGAGGMCCCTGCLSPNGGDDKVRGWQGD